MDEEPVLREAASALQCKTSEVSFFEKIDPFNTQNTVIGALCHIMDHRYGALYISHVNSKYKPQVIWCTPKIHYPFTTSQSGKRSYRFNQCASVTFREKLDGTNILAFSYADGRQHYVSYKTRLMPFLHGSKFGDWVKLWNIILKKHPDIPAIVRVLKSNISFELYGQLNPHLIKYDHELDVSMLFLIDGFHNLREPIKGFPSPKILAKCKPEHIVQTYERLREEFDNRNKAKYAQDGSYEIEGAVLNVQIYHDDDYIELAKCKGSIIEEIHFAAGRGLSKELVTQASHKVMENGLELSYTNVADELMKDFSSTVINSFELEIKTVVNEIIAYIQFSEDVVQQYQLLHLDINTQKGDVMRTLSKHFTKEQMRGVYTIIQRHHTLQNSFRVIQTPS